MSQGYWGPSAFGCRCCHSGPKAKFYCFTCDHVAKAPDGGSPRCLFCREPMTAMGQRWRPGPRGRRGRTPGHKGRVPGRNRQLTQPLSPQEWDERRVYRAPSPGEELLARLTR